MTRPRGRMTTAIVAGGLVLAFVAAVYWFPLAVGLAVGAVFALAGVVLFRSTAWRNSSLVLASLLVGLTGFEVAFGLIDVPPRNFAVVKVNKPAQWSPYDSVVGYRPKPDTSVEVLATFGDKTVFHQTYTIEPSGARRTPGSVPQAPTYLFIGDSFVFGEGLADDETLPSQFAQGLRTKSHVVNLGVLGYGPNHLVRAMEAGLYDAHVVGKVEAVITWIIPDQLMRVTGDGGWLTLSPRYVLEEDGRVRHTGSFLEHRLTNPVAGAAYLARSRVGWVARAMGASLQREQTDLYVALLARLKELVEERYKAPLVLIYQWPDEVVPGANDLDHLPTFESIKALGMKMVSVRQIIGKESRDWHLYAIPHDGHPNARLDALLAKSLLHALDK
ncbi:MAG: hypothetical protein KIT25_23565 [Enhydrobacter sp.]|nr:MAG: hypothetical protein KIT25_23565 [Enhydrobacter sp.]